MSKINIYVLKLDNNKYYVGKSENVEKRFEQHINGNGSSWTKLHKPISIEKVIENANIFDEDNITKEYMSLHGIDNVRGGSYVTEILNDIQKQIGKKIIRQYQIQDLGYFVDGYCKETTVVTTLVTVNAFVELSVNGTVVSGNSICVCPAVMAEIFVPAFCVNASGLVGTVNVPV